MGNKVTTQIIKIEKPSKCEEFKLNKITPVYKDYPLLSNPIFEKDNDDNLEGIQEYTNSKEKVSLISKVNIQKYCKIDETVEKKKQMNIIKSVKSNYSKTLDVQNEAKKLRFVNEKAKLKIIQDLNKDITDLDMIRNTLHKLSFLRDIARDNSFW